MFKKYHILNKKRIKHNTVFIKHHDEQIDVTAFRCEEDYTIFGDLRMRDLEEAHDKYVRTLKTVQSESEDRIAKLTLKLIEDNRLEDLKRASIDKDFREELLKEYHLRRI